MNATRRIIAVSISGGLIFLLVLIFASQTHAQTGTFIGTGSMQDTRGGHTATLLRDGTVLIAGGGGSSGVLATAEVYNPSMGSFSPTGSMSSPRAAPSATLLLNGKVLIAGGLNSPSGGGVAMAELYDPTAGTFSPTGSMNTATFGHTATLLPNGQVLIVGGFVGNSLGNSPTARAELYDPNTGNFSLTGSTGVVRIAHTATLLPNGKVLVAAGTSSLTAELYDPSTGTFSFTGSVSAFRNAHTATLLLTRKVLLAGGDQFNVSGATADLYDPDTDTFSSTGTMGSGVPPQLRPRQAHTATLLHDGKVLITGGFFSGSPRIDADLYDAATGTFSLTTNSMSTTRAGHTATRLPDGRVLIAGGTSNIALSAQLFDPIVPFAAFTPKVEITLGSLADDEDSDDDSDDAADAFEVKTTFALGAGNNGLSPLQEEVCFQVGGLVITFAVASFKEDKKGRFKFEGVIDGVALEAVIRPLGGGIFEFKVEGTGADLTGSVNPVRVILTIGNDGGSASVIAEIE